LIGTGVHRIHWASYRVSLGTIDIRPISSYSREVFVTWLYVPFAGATP
jgi:hypothetical protein